MWELVRANRRKSVTLVFIVLGLLLGLGYAIGATAGPEGGWIGMAVATGIWAVMSLVAYYQGSNILLALGGARRIEKQDHPQLFNVVEEMSIAAGLSKPPDVYIIDDMGLNAFAAGRDPEHAAVAVTAGLLARLNRDQLQGVIAHEIAHIVNRDVLLMTMVGVMVGTIAILADIFLRMVIFGGRGRRYSGGRRGGGGGGGNAGMLIAFAIALALAILAPILARIIYFAVSRKREYLADAHAAVLTRYPEGLASALEVIERHATLETARPAKAVAPMYIVNPFMAASGGGRWSRTHPPTAERIRILRSMAGSASYQEYQRAFSSVTNKSSAPLPASALAAGQAESIRAAQAEPAGSRSRQQHEAADLLRNLHQFIFLTCACGMKLKIPPGYDKREVECPKCHNHLAVPAAAAAGAALFGGLARRKPPPLPAERAPAQGETPQRVKRTGGWQTAECRCGHTLNIPPNIEARQIRCNRCGRTLHID